VVGSFSEGSGEMSLNAESSLNEALRLLGRIVVDGLHHGFFEVTVSCELINEKRRRLLIKAGKSHHFVIAEEDLPSMKS
jgi:hypothetical protein